MNINLIFPKMFVSEAVIIHTKLLFLPLTFLSNDDQFPSSILKKVSGRKTSEDGREIPPKLVINTQKSEWKEEYLYTNYNLIFILSPGVF